MTERMVHVQCAITHEPNLRMYEEWDADVMKIQMLSDKHTPGTTPAQFETEYMWLNLNVGVLCVERPSG